MEKKSKFSSILAGAGKSAKNLLDNATQLADQNADGKFDISDVSILAENMGSAVKKGAQIAKTTAEEKARQLELKTLQPIFPDTLSDGDFLMPKFIRVVERDKRRAESEVCQGSIGYHSTSNGLHIVNIFRDSLTPFGLTFYPDCDSEFYYVDPIDKDSYIALDEYFSYLKSARVNELQKIAQDLGAKHFKVTYREENDSFSEKRSSGHISAGRMLSAKGEHHANKSTHTSEEIAADTTFSGHSPVEPTLKYLQHDPHILNLISKRMDKSSPLMRETLKLNLSSSSGLKEADAAKIDGVLKGLKFSGNASVSSEAKNESRRYLEYEIEF